MDRRKGLGRNRGWAPWQVRLPGVLDFDGVFGCWTKRGGLSSHGYGQISVDGRQVYLHRLMAEMLHGPVHPGMTVDHLCRNRACCNPFHLEIVTRRENIARGTHPAAVAMRTDRCQRGHADWMAVVVRGRPGRACRTCQRDATRRSRQRRKVA